MKKTLKKANQDVNKTLRKAEQDARPTFHKIDDSLRDAEKDLRPSFHKVDDALHNAEEELRPVVKKAGDDIDDLAHKVEREIRHFIRNDKNNNNSDNNNNNNDLAQQLSTLQMNYNSIPPNNTIAPNTHNENALVFNKPTVISEEEAVAKINRFIAYFFQEDNERKATTIAQFKTDSAELEATIISKVRRRVSDYYDSTDTITVEVDSTIQSMVQEMEASKLKVSV